jgi:hypothetical protein
MFRFVRYIKDAVGQFYKSSNVEYSKETIKHVQDMLFHLRKRSDVVDAWDGTYGILLKLKETNAPKKLIELAEKQHELLEQLLESL